MNGVHDMGGMHGMGPIDPEPNEPVFHEPWEAGSHPEAGLADVLFSQFLLGTADLREILVDARGIVVTGATTSHTSTITCATTAPTGNRRSNESSLPMHPCSTMCCWTPVRARRRARAACTTFRPRLGALTPWDCSARMLSELMKALDLQFRQ